LFVLYRVAVKQDGKWGLGESFYFDINGKRIQPSAEDIIDRKDAMEKRLEGFIDFSG
jgi:hypothetical protein